MRLSIGYGYGPNCCFSTHLLNFYFRIMYHIDKKKYWNKENSEKDAKKRNMWVKYCSNKIVMTILQRLDKWLIDPLYKIAKLENHVPSRLYLELH